MDIINTNLKPSTVSMKLGNCKKETELLSILHSFVSGKSKYTGKNYLVGIQQFIDYLGGDPERILTVKPFQISQYKTYIKQSHSHSTVNVRLSSLSSMYSYLIQNEMIEHNPVKLLNRSDIKVNPYERSKTISIEQFNEILDVIPDSPSGIRDRVIFKMIYLSGLRKSSVINLTGKDIISQDGSIYFKTKLKGGGFSKKELPPPVWNDIVKYLEIENRELKDDECVFQPTTTSGDYLLIHHNRRKISDGLSSEILNKNLKRYAKKVGITNLSIHSLRHLGASSYYQDSKDILETMNFLNHKNINTTQVYLQSLNGETHDHWQSMYNKIS